MSYTRWKKGTYMRLISPHRLAAFVGDPRRDPSKKMSARRLAQYVDCHPSMIDGLVTGRKRTCTPELATRIAEVLGVNLDALFVPRNSNDTRTAPNQREVVAA